MTPETLVTEFLRALEARDLGRAGSLLASDAILTFPGSAARFTSLEAMASWASTRYRSVRKTIATFDRMDSGSAVVLYCRGTLAGEWLDGSAFTGIRFVDRFEIADGRILRQDVWNDLAEFRPRAGA
jgi:hypothetical protein